jgi:hypothetical protein
MGAMYTIKGKENGQDFVEKVVVPDENKCYYCHDKTDKKHRTTENELIYICDDCFKREHTEPNQWGQTLLYFGGFIVVFTVLSAITKNM